jgi:Zn-dependent peptidase ImmA (M78 family)
MTSPLSALLRTAQEAAGMTASHLARLAELDPARLQAMSEGHVELSAAELDRCARVFGVRLSDLLDGKAASAPFTLLLRSSLEWQQPDLQMLLTTEVHAGLGEFQRVVRDLSDLEQLLDIPRRDLPTITLLPAGENEHPGERLARTVRKSLGLGIEPLPSMRALLEKELAIRIVWVTEDHLDRTVDGACTIDPRPAILVNLLEPQRHPWRTRITLAHELCHLLFDQQSGGRRTLFSPHGRRSLFPGFDDMEQRARAFAGCFLAPAEGVRATVGSLDPTSEEAIRSVGVKFGVGRTVAVNRLHHVFQLSSSERSAMEVRAREGYSADFSGDDVDESLGFRGGALLALVQQAFEQGKLGATRARKLLGLPMTDPLPFPGVDAARCAPLVSRAEAIRRKADQLLVQLFPSSGLLASEARPEGEGWRVEVIGGGIGTVAAPPRGHMILSRRGDLVVEAIDTSASL